MDTKPAMYRQGDVLLVPVAELPGQAKRRAREGGPRRPDLFYARLAATYVDALHAGHRNPVERVAAAAMLPVERVRTMLHEARSRQLLAGGHQGRATGALTPRAQALLKMARRTRSKKGGRR